MEVTRVFDVPGARAGTAGSLLVVYYAGRTTLQTLEALDVAQGALVKQHQNISSLTVIGQAGMERPDEQVRDRSLALSKKYEANVRASAIVVNTRGIGAVMVRTFLSAFFLLNQSKMQIKVFASVNEALKFLHGFDGTDTSYRDVGADDVLRFCDAK
ncbi:MAG: hypothetical protein ACOZQL_05955 [Myxococcota bacterium]